MTKSKKVVVAVISIVTLGIVAVIGLIVTKHNSEDED